MLRVNKHNLFEQADDSYKICGGRQFITKSKSTLLFVIFFQHVRVNENVLPLFYFIRNFV